MKRFLVFTDGKAGHENQSKALAEGLGGEAVLQRFTFPSRWAKGWGYAVDHLGLPFAPTVPEGRFDAVICTGSNTFLAGKRAARRLGIPVVANLFPRGWRLDFDCIVSPAFDAPPKRANVIETPVNLTPSRPEWYEAKTAEFLARHQPTKPAAALILGGPNAVAQMTREWANLACERFFAETVGMERWVTTSRRTPMAVEHAVASWPFDYQVLYSMNQFNPIPAFVSLAERLVVSSDSTGMLSEAVTRGTAGVEILLDFTGDGGKFGRFVENLCAGGYARIFGKSIKGDAPNRKVDLAPIYAAVGRLLGLE
ncbi:MAG: ELM1/GtrOC1 family putative glycosyltransferase [Kiritimatiellia bacterium]|nr:ELM1/GtrOC1 family putative glycosyltransferase [Kiritimatiellia bacterium]